MTPPDFFIELLVKQSAQRLREMRAQIDANMAKLSFQREYVDQALAEKHASPSFHPSTGAGAPASSVEGKPARRQRASRRSNKRDAIRGVMETNPERIWMPAEVRDRLENQGVDTTRDAVRVAMKRMLELGDVERVGDRNGFKLASRNSTNGDVPGSREGQIFDSANGSESTSSNPEAV